MSKKILVFFILLFLVFFSLFFWWFGPRKEMLIKECSDEIFREEWKIDGYDERITPLERIKTLQEMCLMSKGIK